MNAHERNRGIFTVTGITVTGLPEQYVNDHPERIVASLGSLREVWEPRPNEAVTYDIEFKFPVLQSGKRRAFNAQASGYLTLDLEKHPLNRRLAELVEHMSEEETDIEIYGRQYDNRFYVKAFCPAPGSDFDRKTFFYLLSRIGIDFEFPETVDTEGSEEAAENEYKLIYKIFRDEYPKEIQQYLDENLDYSRYREDVKRFILMDWKPPVLDLPTAKEARRILDGTVYGMEGVKERLLEFLEVIRRSGNLAMNLLLVGPPGTGKTTIMEAVAKMLRLPMSVVPMSACSDLEAFVGFARTYSGAQEALVTSRMMAPVFEYPDGRREVVHQLAQVMFLNELDKTDAEHGHRGSVQSAVLRMTDDNRSFFDVYHQVHFDLSKVVIVADANDLSKLQKPLLDRFEVVEIPPYTDSEKALIFQKYVFPSVLREKGVAKSEVSVTGEAVEAIVSACRTAGVREMKKVAGRIAGNYLLHYARRRSRVYYTPEMVKPFLPAVDVRRTTLVRQPGSIRSVYLAEDAAKSINVQCTVTRAKKWSFRLFGAESALLQQELEAAAVCASNYLSSASWDVKVQLVGVDDSRAALGQLGFPVFAAVLSSAFDYIVEGVFYGGMTLLGGMTCAACNDPDAVRTLAECSGEKRFYTAVGFSERLSADTGGEVTEFLDAETAVALLFGNGSLRRAI